MRLRAERPLDGRDGWSMLVAVPTTRNPGGPLGFRYRRPVSARPRARILCATLGGVVVGLLAACYGPTEVVAEISTDVTCDVVGAKGVVIRTAAQVGQLRDASPRTDSTTCSPDPKASDLGTIVMVPSDDADAFVFEVVVGFTRPAGDCRPPSDVDGCIVARRRIDFVRHRSLRMPIHLDRQCVGIRCGEDETCDRGACVPARVLGCSGGDCLLGSEGTRPRDDAGVVVGAPDDASADAGRRLDASLPSTPVAEAGAPANPIGCADSCVGGLVCCTSCRACMFPPCPNACP